MSILQGLTNPNWLVFALLFLAVLLYLAFMRNREARRVSEKFPRKQIVLTSFGVNYYGLESEAGPPLRSTGALVLLKDRLYYRARFANRELTIPGSAILNIDVTNTHRGRTMRLYVLAIRFLNPEGKGDTVAFRVLSPARWIMAIRATLMGEQTL